MRYLTGAVAVGLLDLGLFVLWVLISAEETCNDGVPRWTCNDFAQGPLLAIAFVGCVIGAVVGPVLFFAGLDRVLKRRKRSAPPEE